MYKPLGKIRKGADKSSILYNHFSSLKIFGAVKAIFISEEIIENGFTIISASTSTKFSVWFIVVAFTAIFTFLFNVLVISVFFKFTTSSSNKETIALQFLLVNPADSKTLTESVSLLKTGTVGVKL